MNAGGLLATPRARFTGAIYVLYLVGVELAWVLVDRNAGAAQIVLLAASLCALLLSLLLYGMLRPVSRRVAAEALLFGVASSGLGILHVCGLGSQVRSIPFLAGFVLLTGYLMFRATFLPRFLGVLMVLCGCGWLAFLVPAVAARTHGHLSQFSLVAEGMVAVWLLVMGVDEQRWQEQAEVAARAEQ